MCDKVFFGIERAGMGLFKSPIKFNRSKSQAVVVATANHGNELATPSFLRVFSGDPVVFVLFTPAGSQLRRRHGK